MRKKIKTPESNMMALPEICDFEGGVWGGNFTPNPSVTISGCCVTIYDRGELLGGLERSWPWSCSDFHRA